MKATLVTRHLSAPIARSVAKSLESDNEAAPKPLHVRSRARGRQVTSIVTRAEDIQSLLTTMDDLMLCVIVADRLLCAIERKRATRRATLRVD